MSTNFCIFLSDLYQPRVLLTRTENQDIFILDGYFLYSNNTHVLSFHTTKHVFWRNLHGNKGDFSTILRLFESGLWKKQ